MKLAFFATLLVLLPLVFADEISTEKSCVGTGYQAINCFCQPGKRFAGLKLQISENKEETKFLARCVEDSRLKNDAECEIVSTLIPSSPRENVDYQCPSDNQAMTGVRMVKDGQDVIMDSYFKEDYFAEVNCCELQLPENCSVEKDFYEVSTDETHETVESDENHFICGARRRFENGIGVWYSLLCSCKE